MGLIMSKGQGQSQVALGHQMKMLHECRATLVFWIIWDVEFDGGIAIFISPEERARPC